MDSGSTARRLPALNHAAFKRYFGDLLADIRKPALVTTENYECVRLFELDLNLEISGRPAPVFIGVSE